MYGELLKSPHYSLVPKDVDANILFRIELLERCAGDASFAAKQKQMCREDILYYINAYVFTSDPRLLKKGLPSRIPFVTYEFQDDDILEMANSVISGEDVGIAKSRDMGASWMCLVVFEWFWHFYKDLNFLITSRNEKYVDVAGNPKCLFWKIDFIHENQPRWLLPDGRWLILKDPQRKSLHLGNEETGSIIDGESTTGDIGRGDRRTAMLIDEHAAFQKGEGFRVMSASRDTSDCRIFNSTPQGSDNAFYEVIHNTPAVNVIRMHWSRHPDKAEGSYRFDKITNKIELLDDFTGMVWQSTKFEKRRKVLYPGNYQFRRDGKIRSPWYDWQCDRCANDKEVAQELDIDFVGSDYLFFDPPTVQLYIDKYCKPPMSIGDIEYDPNTGDFKRYAEDGKGNLQLWLQLRDGRPPAEGRYIIGSDVSAGTGASNSVTSVVDETTGEKVAVFISPDLKPTEFALQTIAVAKFFNRGGMIWDGSGPTGETFKKTVLDKGYGNIYYRRNEDKVGRPISDKPGYFLTNNTRTSILQDYRYALTRLFIINRSKSGLKECLQFVHRTDGTVEHRKSSNDLDPTGARSAHGDEVIADALCCKMMEERRGSIETPAAPEIPIGSLAWRIQMRNNKRSIDMAINDGLGSEWG